MKFEIDFQYSDSNLFNTSNNILSILLKQDGFLFLAHNKEQKSIVHFEKISLPPLKRINQYYDYINKFAFDANKWQAKNINEYRFINCTPYNTIIPASIFDNSKLSDFYNLSFDNGKESLLKYYHVNKYSSYLIYPFPPFFDDFEADTNIKYFSQSAPLFEYISKQSHTVDWNFYISIYEDFFDIVVIKENKLHLYNSFRYKNETDFLYFVLNTIEQLNLKSVEFHINCIGVKSKNDSKLQNLRRFAENVFLIKDCGLNYNFSINPELINEHLNFLNIHLCE